MAKRLRVLDDAHLSYGHPGGTAKMRSIISTYLRAARGVRCDPDQVILLSGGQQAVDLVIKTLLDPLKIWWRRGSMSRRACEQTANFESVTSIKVRESLAGLL